MNFIIQPYSNIPLELPPGWKFCFALERITGYTLLSLMYEGTDAWHGIVEEKEYPKIRLITRFSEPHFKCVTDVIVPQIEQQLTSAFTKLEDSEMEKLREKWLKTEKLAHKACAELKTWLTNTGKK